MTVHEPYNVLDPTTVEARPVPSLFRSRRHGREWSQVKRVSLALSLAIFVSLGALWTLPAKAEWHVPPRHAPTVPHWTADWNAIGECESGGGWHINTGNGYFGGLQFAYGTWRANGGPWFSGHGRFQFPVRMQKRIAERVKARSGLGAWPYCGRFG